MGNIYIYKYNNKVNEKEVYAIIDEKLYSQFHTGGRLFRKYMHKYMKSN